MEKIDTLHRTCNFDGNVIYFFVHSTKLFNLECLHSKMKINHLEVKYCQFFFFVPNNIFSSQPYIQFNIPASAKLTSPTGTEVDSARLIEKKIVRATANIVGHVSIISEKVSVYTAKLYLLIQLPSLYRFVTQTSITWCKFSKWT